jgi:Zn-dependent protease with chaperone function
VHESLREFALRRRWLGDVALVLVCAGCGFVISILAAIDPVWPPDDKLVVGGDRTVVAGAALGAAFAGVLLVSAALRAGRRAWPTRAVRPAPDLVPLVEGAAIARGEPVPRVWRLDSAAPNLACLPGPGGRHVVISTALEGGLSRDELEALAALQFSLLLDDGAARSRRSIVAAARAITWTLRFLALALVVALVRHIVWAGLTINMAIWFGLGLGALIGLLLRRLRWTWGLISDAVAVETTRHPEPLVRALRRLAGYNGEQVPVMGSWGAADPYWVAPVRRHVAVSTMVVNNRARTRSSTEQVSDASLLLRAGIVERICLGGEPATEASWRAARATFDRLGRFGGDQHPPGSIDGTVDGVTVTADGAVGAPPPTAGAWPAPAQVSEAGHRARPPSRADLAAYEGLADNPPPPRR